MLASVAATTSTNSPNFILPNGTIVIEVLLFVIVLGITSVFVLKPVQRAISDREARIRAAQQAGDQAQHEAEELERERHMVLEGARGEARELLEEATRTVERLRTEAHAEGQAEHDRLLAEAESTIEHHRRQVREEILGRLDILVGEAASRVAGAPIDVSRHRELIEAAIARSGNGGEEQS